MLEMTNFPASVLRPETMMAAAQRGLTCWSQACTELAHGYMAASMAQIDAARSLYGVEAGDWSSMTSHLKPHDAAERVVTTARARYEAAVNAYRKINDDLAAHVFKAAEALAGAFEDEPAPKPVEPVVASGVQTKVKPVLPKRVA